MSQKSPALPAHIRMLPPREREIAAIFYVNGAQTVAQVAASVAAPNSRATVRKAIARLTARGMLRRHSSIGGRHQRHLYVPTSTAEGVIRRFVDEVSTVHFGGSLVAMIDDVLGQLDHEARALVARHVLANRSEVSASPAALDLAA